MLALALAVFITKLYIPKNINRSSYLIGIKKLKIVFCLIWGNTSCPLVGLAQFILGMDDSPDQREMRLAMRIQWSNFKRILRKRLSLLRGWAKVLSMAHTLQIKGRRASNINVWFPFMYSQKWNCYFQNRIIMLCLPVPTLIYLWEIYIFQDRSAFSAAGKYVDWSWKYINRSQTWMWELGLMPHNSQKRNT